MNGYVFLYSSVVCTYTKTCYATTFFAGSYNVMEDIFCWMFGSLHTISLKFASIYN